MTEETTVVEETTENTSNADTSAVDLAAFFGVKAGMTRIFDEAGNHVPVTVIKLEKNFITQVKNSEKDGYSAYQVGYFAKKDKHVNKATKGRLAKQMLKQVLLSLLNLELKMLKLKILEKNSVLVTLLLLLTLM